MSPAQSQTVGDRLESANFINEGNDLIDDRRGCRRSEKIKGAAGDWRGLERMLIDWKRRERKTER